MGGISEGGEGAAMGAEPNRRVFHQMRVCKRAVGSQLVVAFEIDD